ncbi:unnamed protein product [Enterobius vermicularis]|uniref:RING-CH-type domain-containing protein n=1 Tax=Enterobius vermicularis TaxID=51028 RepID=A0A0N4UW08_ENTVE|nr:unnamed protein product [Enterobius vermicularis]
MPKMSQAANLVSQLFKKEMSTTDSATCSICKISIGARTDDHSIRPIMSPCLCKKPVHRGCAADVLRDKKRCQECRKRYAYYQYGTFCDYVWRYPCRTTLPILFYLFAFVCIVHKIYETDMINPSFKNYLILLRSEILVLLLVSIVLIPCMFYIYGFARKNFVKQHGQVVALERISAPKIINNNNLQQTTCSSTLNGSMHVHHSNQTSINVPTNLTSGNCLAASTPLPTKIGKPEV